MLVCNSIGCALARLYAAAHPGRVAACLFLDSMMANSDFVSVFPDPDGPDFDHPGRGRLPLPPGVSADDLRHARDKFRQYFHPAVPNPERLDRRDLRRLLPRADAPALPAGPGGRSPILVVVGHDWDEFAEQCEKVRRFSFPAGPASPRGGLRIAGVHEGGCVPPGEAWLTDPMRSRITHRAHCLCQRPLSMRT